MKGLSGEYLRFGVGLLDWIRRSDYGLPACDNDIGGDYNIMAKCVDIVTQRWIASADTSPRISPIE